VHLISNGLVKKNTNEVRISATFFPNNPLFPPTSSPVRNVQYLQQIQHNEVTQNWKKQRYGVDGSEIPNGTTCGM